jgi:hypothetical protein
MQIALARLVSFDLPERQSIANSLVPFDFFRLRKFTKVIAKIVGDTRTFINFFKDD